MRPRNDHTRIPLTIVGLGDSTTAGTPGFRSPVEAPPSGLGDVRSQYAYWLMKWHPHWRVYNRGINGERTDHIIARLDRDVLEQAADVVVVVAGVNDVYEGRPWRDVVKQLERLFERVRAARVALVAGSILPYNSATSAQNSHMFRVNFWIRDYVAAHTHMAFADTRSAVAARGTSDLLASSPDGLHPSVSGYRRMARAIEPAIAEALTRVA